MSEKTSRISSVPKRFLKTRESITLQCIVEWAGWDKIERREQKTEECLIGEREDLI